MKKLKFWITLFRIYVIIFVIFVTSLFIVNFYTFMSHGYICNRYGYERPITYLGKVYCFGKNYLPEIVSLDSLTDE